MFKKVLLNFLVQIDFYCQYAITVRNCIVLLNQHRSTLSYPKLHSSVVHVLLFIEVAKLQTYLTYSSGFSKSHTCGLLSDP